MRAIIRGVIALILVAIVGALLALNSAVSGPEEEASAPRGVSDLQAYLALPEPERLERAARASAIYEDWLGYEQSVNEWRTAMARLFGAGKGALPQVSAARESLGRGVLVQMARLEEATRLDPTHARAQVARSDLLAETGASDEALRTLDLAEAALAARTDLAAAEQRSIEIDVARARAWLHRDAGEWDDGLAAAGKGLPLAPNDIELRLVRGLLLAGAGRVAEAQDAARELPAIEYRVFAWEQVGRRRSRSDYGSRWIQAMTFFAQGETRLARHVLGSVNTRRLLLPFGSRYWNDVGLVHELDGLPEDAQLHYGLAALALPHGQFFPKSGFSCEPKVLDLPDVRVPCFVSWRDEFVAGSRFTYTAQLVAQCAVARDSVEIARAAAPALRALRTCQRFGIRPDHVLALRGQVYCALGRREEAAADLAAAHAAFAANGSCDARTSMLLGILRLEDERFVDALGCLRESVAADSTLAPSWRSLGVALARTGDRGAARAAMDRALRIEPRSPEGWYNRGLLAVEEKRWVEALGDLRVAVQFASDDPQIIEALQLAEQGRRRAGVEASADVSRVPEPMVPAPPLPSPSLRVVGIESDPTSTPQPIARAWVDSTVSPRGLREAMRNAERAWGDRPDPERRREFANCCLRADEPQRAREVLAAAWTPEMAPVDLCLLLQADRALGRIDHALALVGRLDLAAPRPPDADLWALVGLVCLDGGQQREGLRALDAAIALAPGNTALRAHRAFIASHLTRE